MVKATFGAGCFWHPQHIFDEINGVIKTEVGYMGGHTSEPTYEEVCTGSTGHAEVVHIEFDPEKVSYENLLNTFWDVHDPTQFNRQGPDIGTQYRSTIFYHDKNQGAEARDSKDTQANSKKYNLDIMTVIEKAETFWIGESYHQKYFARMNRPGIISSLFNNN